MRINELNKRRRNKPLIMRMVTNSFDYDGDSNDEDIVIMPFDSAYTYDFTIDWGDGSTEQLSNSDAQTYSGFLHEYATAGTYDVKIIGKYPYIDGRNAGLFPFFDNIVQWGNVAISELTFENNINFTNIIAKDTPDFTNVLDFSLVFHEIGWTEIPNNLFLKATNATDFYSCFEGYKGASIPEGLFKNCFSASDFNICFALSSITSLPSNLFPDNAQIFTGTFANSKLESVNNNIFSNISNPTTFQGCFRGNTTPERAAITGNVPELWNNFPTADGTNCFEGQTNITNYNDIPTDWK